MGNALAFHFGPRAQGICIDRTEQNQDLFARLMTDQNLTALVTRSLRKDVYERILGANDGD